MPRLNRMRGIDPGSVELICCGGAFAVWSASCLDVALPGGMQGHAMAVL